MLPEEQRHPLLLDLLAQGAIGRLRVQSQAIHVQERVRIVHDVQHRLPFAYTGGRANDRQIYVRAFMRGPAGAGTEKIDRLDEGQGLEAVDERVVGCLGCHPGRVANPSQAYALTVPGLRARSDGELHEAQLLPHNREIADSCM